jgi:cytochrome c peroxidase
MVNYGRARSRGLSGLQRPIGRIVAVLGILWGLGTGWSAWSGLQSSAAQTTAVPPELQEPLQPLPLTVVVDPNRAALGARLFQDVRLSGPNTIACTTCHQLARGGDDGQPQPRGADGSLLPRNAPTVFNVAFNFVFHWDGAFPTLEAQAEQVLLNPSTMRTSWPEVLAKLQADRDYVVAFGAAYPDGLTSANVLDALATYERSLITPNAPFDRYLRGEHQALTVREQRGYQLFKAYGCVACHHGVNVGGNLFQKFGIFPAMLGAFRPDAEADTGRFSVTGVARDRGVFRVPGLRNVALTAPYFHDGSAPTLEEAVDIMARGQLGRKLNREEIDVIVQFLRTLTGDFQGQPLADTLGEAR